MSVTAVRPQPTLATLLKRLADYTHYELDADVAAERVASNIKAAELDTCICAGAMVEGRWRVLRFSDYYREVFGRELDGRVVKQRKKTA